IKEGCSFSSCSSSVNGGAIYAELNFNAALSIDNGIFKDCNCTQPGNGGSLCILQQTDSSKIFITNTSFINCLTLAGTSNQYGWGGAIYINISYNPPSLTATNFQLTDLSFTNCNASGAGNNLHILSDDTTAVGNQIKTGFLLTVKDLFDPSNIISDLYTSPQYSYDYMGINKSIELVNLGTINLDLHNPLFEQFFISIIPNPSYVDGINGKDIKFCGVQSSMCKTIKNSLERNPTPFSGNPPSDSSYSIILTSSTALETNIQIMSTTLLNGHIMIQSDEYNPTENYTKQSIQTSSFSSSLFTISGTSHLQLHGLHFDNLNPSSNNPLISIQSDDNEQIPKLQINDCEFESTVSDSYLNHSIISINGGIMSLARTKIESYKLMNGISLINIKSDKVSIVTISQTTFTSIAQTGAGNGAVISAELYQDCILQVTDSCTFYNCSTQQNDNCVGGAINAYVNGSNSQFIVSDLVKFEKCQSYKGGAISVELLNTGTCVVNNVQFKECIVNNDGGGIFAQLQNSGGTLTITNQTSFVQCINTEWGYGGGILISSNGLNSRCIISDNVKFNKCKAHRGGAVCIELYDGASFEVHNVIFKECEAKYQGGAIYIGQYDGASFDVHNVIFKECKAQYYGGAISIDQDYEASFDVHNVIFKECESQYYIGGAIQIREGYYKDNMGSITATISESTFSGSKSLNSGGAIFAELSYDAALTIDNTQFESCYSTNSDGGSIFAQINNGSLQINLVSFVGSSCSQPGSGGAIAIVQYNSNNHISITDSSFTNCLTLPGSSSQRYGWGGAIYIQIIYQASLLTETNFLLTDLSFTNCTAFENIGNNLHILSPNTYNSGLAIAANSLLTVKDLTDLYTNDSYSNDYMGINESNVNNGLNDPSYHQALFLAGQLGFITKKYYINSPDGYDTNDCSLLNPCKTINNILLKSLPDGFVKGLSIVVINLLSETSDQDNIFINSETELNNIITVQSNGYQSGGTQYTKQSIQTQQNTYSLFAISNTGRLKLLGLHFDNLKPSSTYPLILISTSTSND
ncbi:MAG: hypothetical protein EZS28_032024, partial [Streblomastix strix]